MHKLLKNIEIKSLKIQNCLSQNGCKKRGKEGRKLLQRTKHQSEFFEFRFYVKILGLGIRALTFFVTFLCQDKKVKRRK
jgi:hypothetical protein